MLSLPPKYYNKQKSNIFEQGVGTDIFQVDFTVNEVVEKPFLMKLSPVHPTSKSLRDGIKGISYNPMLREHGQTPSRLDTIIALLMVPRVHCIQH
ncbi:predicted protein [Botrytis cinerea T4]|uniref:Uncharacterized protein n=1 Tax=Botryotinia fuckeliana (strain T4) TaxID=999810 RepID=G2Y0W7_BOTF4|nr:predicted protein [Botrytis cinerea T4]